MHKNALFLSKICKNRPALGLFPQTPATPPRLRNPGSATEIIYSLDFYAKWGTKKFNCFI